MKLHRFSPFKACNHDEDKIVAKEWYSLLSVVPVVQGHSENENAEMKTLFRNELGKQKLQDFLGYVPSRKGGRYVEGTIVKLTKLDVTLAFVIRCLS